MSVCNFCKKAFATNLNRDNHIQKFHSNINESKISEEQPIKKESIKKEKPLKLPSQEQQKQIKKILTLNYNSDSDEEFPKIKNPKQQTRENMRRTVDNEFVKKILIFPNDSNNENDGFHDDDDGFLDDDYDNEIDYDDDDYANNKVYEPENDDLPDQTNEKAVIDYKFNKLIESMINPLSIESGRPNRRHISEYKFKKIFFEAINKYIEIVVPPICDRFKNFFVYITDDNFSDFGYIYNKIYNDFSKYDKSKLTEELEGGKIYSLSDRIFNPEQERILQRFLCFMKKDPKLINISHDKIKILIYNTIKVKEDNNNQQN